MKLDYDAQCYCPACLPDGECTCEECNEYPDGMLERVLYHPVTGYALLFLGGVAFTLAAVSYEW